MWRKANGALTESYDDLVPEEDFELTQGCIPVDRYFEQTLKRPDLYCQPSTLTQKNAARRGRSLDAAARRIVKRMKEIGL